MSTAASPVPLSHPPSQQARPTSPSRSPRGLLPRWACAVLAACLALAVFAAGPHTPKADTSSITGDQDLAKQVIDLLPDDYQARGIHVSVITADGARHAGIGTAASGQQYTSTTPMEIGSITKTFTGQLLADAIARGEVRAGDPLSAHLPELAGTPAGEATLEEIASHRSGLPSFPSQDMGRLLRAQILGLNPFTDSANHLIERTRTTELGERDEFAYSNLGISLSWARLSRAPPAPTPGAPTSRSGSSRHWAWSARLSPSARRTSPTAPSTASRPTGAAASRSAARGRARPAPACGAPRRT